MLRHALMLIKELLFSYVSLQKDIHIAADLFYKIKKALPN